jgi:hypothetical protein
LLQTSRQKKNPAAKSLKLFKFQQKPYCRAFVFSGKYKMDIKELQNYRLGDAVKFHKTLNPKIWGTNEHLLPEVREKLLAIAADFQEFLGLDLEVKDVTISGSNAAYTYTDHSDIDLHLVTDIPRADSDDVYRELFDAKKYQYNDQHDFVIGKYPVELYVQNANQDHVSQGIYSVTNNTWISVPKRRQPNINDISVRSKYEDMGQRIDAAIESGDLEKLDAIGNKLRSFRQAGLDASGEFGPENLAFKVLRNNGTLDRLRAARTAAKNQALSLTEKKKKRKKKMRYGSFGGAFFPGYHYYGQTDAAADGGGGGESVRESADDLQTQLEKFAAFCVKKLGIENPPGIQLKRDPEWSRRNATFGRYIPETNVMILSVADRHPMDIMRTLAHELVHRNQDEHEPMPDHAGATGSEWENEANARAGVLMRSYGEQNPDAFDKKALAEVARQKLNFDEIYGKYLKVTVNDGDPNKKGFSLVTPLNGESWNWRERPEKKALVKRLLNQPGWLGDYKYQQIIDAMAGNKFDPARHLAEDANDMSTEDMIEYLRQHHDKNLHPDYLNHLTTTNSKFVLKNIPLTSVRTELSGLDRAKVEQYKKMDFTKAPPIVIGSDGYILDGYHRANVAKALGIFTVKAYVGVKGQQVVAEASGYIPVTDAEARDPRYSMAVTADIKPGEPRRQAAKLGWKTTAAGTPPTARTNGLVEELTRKLQMVKEGIGFPLVNEEDLEEVAMSPSSLRAFANSPAAAGMQAGFEAELIFTGLGDGEELDPEWEPDYDYDTRADNIEEIIDFFQSGDFADLSNRGADSLRNEMSEQYMEWLDEKMMEDWAVDQDGAIRDMIANNEPDLSDDELEDRVNTALSDQNSDYESALDAYREDWGGNYDEGDWLRDAGITHMSEAANEYDLNWPHYVDLNSGMGSEGGFNEENAERLADDLAENLGVKTTVSGGYHSAKRDATTWIFEPDSSLDPSGDDDMPVEIVSPPMPLTQALEILPKFFEWAKENGAYANKTTGFHMSVSMPDHEGGALDYVKLALFLGDEYVLEQFGRAANTYAKSAISKIRDAAGTKLQEDDTRADAVLKNMRSSLNQFAARALAQPSGFGKYTSINPKGNYIEFRSAGGSDYFEDIEKIQNTLMRYAQATNLAMDPAAEKPEYAKKLYKLLTKTETEQVTDPRTGTKRTVAKPSGNDDAIAIFSRYVAGELPQSALKSFIKQIQYGRELDKNKPTAKTMWQVTHPNGSSVIKVSAASAEEAIKIAKQEWGDRMNPDDAYRAEPVTTDQQPSGSTTAPPADDPRGNYVLRRRQGDEGVGPVLYRFSAGTTTDAIRAARRWAEARGIDRQTVYLDSIESLSPEELQPATTGTPIPLVTSQPQNFPAARPAGGQFTGRWKIVSGATGEVLHTFGGIGNSQSDANRVAADWIRRTGFDDAVEVYPEMA